MQNDIIFKTATEQLEALQKGELTSQELVTAHLDRAKECEKLGIYLECDREKILKQAKESDERRAKKQIGTLEGIPVAIKDNICINGETVSCASKFLENFRAPYNATVIEKLKSAGAVLFGRTNMDEFAMGSSTENSAFQITHNPWDAKRVPGGSSGGSAAAVAACTVPLSIGSDTGGSIRQPAALCGTFGMKPTYGRVSRYGLVAFASSLDQIGPFSRSVEDSALLLHVLNGHDPKDSTSHPDADKKSIPLKIKPFRKEEWSKLKVALFLPDDHSLFDSSVLTSLESAIRFAESRGAIRVPIKSSLWDHAISIYYILATAEASSNLSRYDGVRYGKRAENPSDLLDLYVRSRTEGFGHEVKRRILLGTFVLSSGYYDAYYNRAQKARRLIQEEYARLFKQVDVILQPTSPSTAFLIGEKSADPLAMYQNDLLTIPANLGGTPAINIPVGRDAKGLPIGLQLTGNYFDEERLLRIARSFMENPEFKLDYRDIKL